MKRTHRLLSMLLAVIMVLSSFVTVSFATEAAEPTTWWHDNAADAFAGGEGTEAKPYQIATAAQLAYFANYLEGGALNGKTEKTYFKLTADIDMSAHQWRPVGYTSPITVTNTVTEGDTTTEIVTNTYANNTLNQAVLDGNGKIISGVKLTASYAIKGYTYDYGCALFTKIVDSTVTNLTVGVKIQNPVLTADKTVSLTAGGAKNINVASSGVAALAAGTFGATTVENVNVTVDMDVNQTGGEYIYAGAVAYALENTVMKNCVSAGTMDITMPASTTGYFGGFLGRYFAKEITNVTNKTAMNVVASKGGSYYGGVVAMTQTGPKGGNLINNGDMDITLASGGHSYVGGVFGSVAVLRNKSGNVFTASHNYGDITVHSSNSAFFVGGVAGQVGHYDTNMIGYTNAGDITVYKSTTTNSFFVGGLVGELSGSSGYASAKMTDCVNTGNVSTVFAENISTLDTSVRATVCQGGIVGKATRGNLTNCVNKGDLSVLNSHGQMFLGGITGRLEVNAGSAIQNCTNNGYITVTDGALNIQGNGTSYVGGAVGHVAGTPTLTKNTNEGNIDVVAEGSLYIGGVIGCLDIGSASQQITSCINRGDVSGIKIAGVNLAVGGIAGRIDNDKYVDGATLSIDTCVNVGKIQDGSLCGGVVGYFASSRKKINGTDTVYNYTVNMNQCFSVGSETTFGLVGSSRANQLNLTDCFYDTEWALSYHHQNALYANGTNVSINGVKQTGGDDTKYNPTGAVQFSIETLDKARVRLDAEGTNESGIRFDSYIEKAAYDALAKMSGVTFELGTMIAPTENLKIASVEPAYDKMAALDALGGTRYVVVPVVQSQFHSSANYDAPDKYEHYYFSGALKKLKNYELAFSAIAYVKITIGDFSFTVYADYDTANTDRSRSIAQIATMAFEDRVAGSSVINGIPYTFEANAENECFMGSFSPYSNTQLTKLKEFSNYKNDGVLPEGLTVNAVSIKDYKIVYAQSPIYKKYGSKTDKTLIEDLGDLVLRQYTVTVTKDGDKDVYSYDLIEDATTELGNVLLGDTYDYDYQTACRIRDLIYKEYGVLLDVVEDVATPESNYEILVGKTNRAKSQSTRVSKLSIDEYLFRIDETKVVVCGGSYGATWHAVDELEALFGEIAEPNYNLKMAGYLDGSYYMQKIACIGDSITRGSQAIPDGNDYGGPDGATAKFGSVATEIYLRQFLSYPANLQRLMWKDAVVYNFGRGGSRAINTGDSSYYRNSSEWNSCLTTAEEVAFDLVFMQHGTNDAGTVLSGGTTREQEYQFEVRAMMDAILATSRNCKFVINSVPHAFDGNYATRNEEADENMRRVQKETAEALNALGYIVYHFDMGEYTRVNLVNDGKTPCVENNTKGNYYESESAIHGDYYNINTGTSRNEGTHPNFRGYNKMADGVRAVVDYILFGKDAPEYMIAVGTPDGYPEEEPPEWTGRY